MSGADEYLIDQGAASFEVRSARDQQILRIVRASAVRLQTDIPELEAADPPEVHAAAGLLRSAAGKTSQADLKYAMTGYLDATEPRIWYAYVAFMPWSIDGDVCDSEGRIILKVDDGTISTVFLDPAQAQAVERLVGPGGLRLWRDVQAERQAERREWAKGHVDVMAGVLAAILGLVLIPLPGPGWPLLLLGLAVVVTGAVVRGVTHWSRGRAPHRSSQ